MRKRGRFGQHPHAAVLAALTREWRPEILFEQGIGNLFTVRVADSVANEDEQAWIEYAVDHVGVPLCCVVLGYSNCGVATAVVEGDNLPVEIEHLVGHIRGNPRTDEAQVSEIDRNRA